MVRLPKFLICIPAIIYFISGVSHLFTLMYNNIIYLRKETIITNNTEIFIILDTRKWK